MVDGMVDRSVTTIGRHNDAGTSRINQADRHGPGQWSCHAVVAGTRGTRSRPGHLGPGRDRGREEWRSGGWPLLREMVDSRTVVTCYGVGVPVVRGMAPALPNANSVPFTSVT